MIELGELEARKEDFARRNVRIVVVSVDGREDSMRTQEKFPHLTVLSDSERKLITLADLVHTHGGRDGSDIATPTTFLIDRNGTVKWVFRPDRVIERLSPAELLEAIDKYLPRETKPNDFANIGPRAR